VAASIQRTLWNQVVERFTLGEFKRRAPTMPGVYPVWARDGIFRGYVEVFIRDGRAVYSRNGRASPRAEEVHAGWWWSRPVPQLPSAPRWEVTLNDMRRSEEHERRD
jgi:hypothetical protein